MSAANALLTVMALVTLVLGVVINKKGTDDFRNQIVQAPEQPEVLSEISEESPSPLPSISPTHIPQKTSQPTIAPTAAFDISVFVYPGGTVIERSTSHLAITSTDSPNNIIPWYKEKISEYKFSAKSFASTNTNGNFLTKMAGSGADGELKVEIRKAAADTVTLIEVDL